MINHKLFKFCPRCGHPVKNGIRFCPHCGHDMAPMQNHVPPRNFRYHGPAPMHPYQNHYKPSHNLAISLIVAGIILLVAGGGYIYHVHNVNTYLSNKQQNSSPQNNTSTPNNNKSNNSSNSGSNEQHPEAVKNAIISYWKNVESVANQYGSASDNRSELGSYFVDGSSNSDCHSIASWAANITSDVKIHAHVESIHFDGKHADVTTQVDYDYYGSGNDHSESHTWHSEMEPFNGSYKFISTDFN